MNTAKKGVKYLLKEKPAVLLRNLNAQRAAVGIKPYPRKHFYRLVGVRCVVCVCVCVCLCWVVVSLVCVCVWPRIAVWSMSPQH